jgi:hypothetical protein
MEVPDVELVLFIGALVALDVLALRFGYDSRDNGAMDHHQRALDAIRGGDSALYHEELRAFEEELQKHGLIQQ